MGDAGRLDDHECVGGTLVPNTFMGLNCGLLVRRGSCMGHGQILGSTAVPGQGYPYGVWLMTGLFMIDQVDHRSRPSLVQVGSRGRVQRVRSLEYITILQVVVCFWHFKDSYKSLLGLLSMKLTSKFPLTSEDSHGYPVLSSPHGRSPWQSWPSSAVLLFSPTLSFTSVAPNLMVGPLNISVDVWSASG